ncbi:hypothetical protein GGI18_005121, partial [Coemansia linderi]
MLLSTTALFCAELWPRKSTEYVLAEDGDSDVASASRFGIRAPVEDANIFSQLTFSWMSPLLKLGQHKQISEDDLWEVPSDCAPANIAETFDANWQHEIDHSEKRSPSLIRALWRTVGAHYVLGGCFKLAQDILSFSKPVVLSMILGFVASHKTDKPQPMSFGYFYAGCMLALQITQSIALNQSLQLGYVTAIKIKSSLTTAIYKKAVWLSNETRQKYKTGEIFTMLTSDVDSVARLSDHAHIFWSGPLQIILGTYLLYNTLGWSALASIVVMVASMPVNRGLTARMQVLKKEQRMNKGKRIALVGEALSGAKIIKLYAWERPILSKIQYVRESLELASLSKFGRMFAWASVSMTTVPFLVSFTTFLVYSAFDGVSHGPLNARLVFVSLSLFNLLRSPLTMLPKSISTLVDAGVAAGRIHKLLTSDELDVESVTRLESVRRSNRETLVQGRSNMDFAVKVSGGSFRWSSKDSVQLDNINLSALSNEHLAIVGRVGSGKS